MWYQDQKWKIKDFETLMFCKFIGINYTLPKCSLLLRINIYTFALSLQYTAKEDTKQNILTLIV